MSGENPNRDQLGQIFALQAVAQGVMSSTSDLFDAANKLKAAFQVNEMYEAGFETAVLREAGKMCLETVEMIMNAATPHADNAPEFSDTELEAMFSMKKGISERIAVMRASFDEEVEKPL
jgi:hypothetical protein